MKAHCLPFAQIPHQTRLFLDYLAHAPSVQSFYPRSPSISEWLQQEASTLPYEDSRRQRVAEILQRQSDACNASPKIRENIARFRKGAVAVVTGQQVGLFGGPTFSLYKALTAVKLAEQATQTGIDTVPVFWLASYDHDLAEVNHVALPSAEGTLKTLSTPSQGIVGAPVSTVRLGEEILPVLEEAAGLLGESEITAILRDSYKPGETLSTAFARFYCHLLADWGVILLDASDPELHRIAQPVYQAAVEQAGELAEKLVARGEQLESAGYHQQVKVTASSVLLFTLQKEARTAIQRASYGKFVIGAEGSAETIPESELLARIASHPEQFSPNVLLRPVIEDYLLPTLAYTGGAAEVAYFGQAAVVYEALLGRVTPIVPRFSATLVEPKAQRLLERYAITVPEIFEAPEKLKQQLAAKSLPQGLQAAFEQADISFATHIARIQEELAKLDRTLVDAAQTAASKMQHQMEKLRTQAARAEGQKEEVIARHAETLSHALYPGKGLQERGIGGIYFLAKYGLELLTQIYSAMNSDCHDHQIVEL